MGNLKYFVLSGMAFFILFVYQNCSDQIRLEAPIHQASLGQGGKSVLPQPPVVTKFSNGINGYACYSGRGSLSCAGSIQDSNSMQMGSPLVYVVPMSNTPREILDHQVQALSSGPYHICYLDGGEVFCWGMNDSGQLGSGSYVAQASPTKVVGLSGKAVKIGAGYAHTCALMENGSVQCWGFADHGRLGSGEYPLTMALPTPVKGLESGSTDLLVGAHTTCVVQNEILKCWGNDLFSSLNSQRLDPQNRPYHIDDPTELPFLNYHSQMKVILGGNGIYVLDKDILRFWGFRADETKSLGEALVGGENGVSEIFEPESVLASVVYRKGSDNFTIMNATSDALTGFSTTGALISGANGICYFDMNMSIQCGGNDEGQFGIGFPASSSSVQPQASHFHGTPVRTGF